MLYAQLPSQHGSDVAKPIKTDIFYKISNTNSKTQSTSTTMLFEKQICACENIDRKAL